LLIKGRRERKRNMKEKQRRTNDERNRKTEIVKIIGKPKREFSNVNLNSVDVFFEINS